MRHAPPRFGLFLPQIGLSFGEIESRVAQAEALGFHSVWLMDHLAAPGAPNADCFEGWTLATALAARTSRIRIGHLVLCDGFRHPSLLAKMAATLDQISGGRLELGLGWGSVPQELVDFGLGERKAGERAARLRETLEILALLFSGEPVDYEGRYYRLRGAVARPLPAQAKIPIHIGGAGPKLTLPLVRELADWWNCVSTACDRFDELRPQIGDARISIQRPIGLASSPEARDESVARAERRFRGWGGLIAGTADEVADALARDFARGVELAICVFSDGARPETLDRFASEVIPRVAAG